MSGIFSNNTQSKPSLRDAAQCPERVLEVDTLINDIACSLSPQRVMVTEPCELSSCGPAPIRLKTGDTMSAESVRDIMLRLEFLRTIARDTFEALSRLAHNSSPLSDWHAVNSETYRLGTTADSGQYAGSRYRMLRDAFFDGVLSVFSFGQNLRRLESQTTAESPSRLGFEFAPGVREVILSATQGSESGWVLQSPEMANGK